MLVEVDVVGLRGMGSGLVIVRLVSPHHVANTVYSRLLLTEKDSQSMA